MLDLIYDSADIGMCVTDSSGRFVRVNKAYCRTYGYSREELEGQSFTMVLPEGMRDYANDLHRRFISGETNESAGEWQVQCKDGQIRDIQVTAGRMIDPSGAVYKVTTVTDITRRKAETKALEEAIQAKEELVREVHHRVRNNLNIVSGLLQLQADKVSHIPNVHPLFSDSIHRIRTLAQIHERLHKRSGLIRIQMNDYLGDLLTMLSEDWAEHTGEVLFQTEVDAFELNIEQSICCGLIVNEAVSNALKHGKPADAARELQVRIKHSADQNTIDLTIADNGPGFPPDLDPANSNSLGLQLIHNLAHQLKATLSFDNEGGARLHLNFAKAE